VQESFLQEEIGGQVELTLVIVTQAKKQNRCMLVNEKNVWLYKKSLEEMTRELGYNLTVEIAIGIVVVEGKEAEGS
jgi:hypothetical protein